MLQSNSRSRTDAAFLSRRLGAVAAIIFGAILIATGAILALKKSDVQEAESWDSPPALAVTSPSPISTAPAAIVSPTSSLPPTPSNPEELGLTLEEFQAKYESLSEKSAGQESFFETAVGKKIHWTVRVDNVFLTSAGVIVVFSSVERPDWAAFPISDARFPLRLEKQLMALSRGDVIQIEGKITDRGIKTLDGLSFQLLPK